jgi:NAD(P)-dependent dehydrogenase (short-subunit alcohol dehydrogenase family)
MGELAGKVVLISGVGAGLGSAVARVALREGATAVLGDLDGAELTRLRAELDPSGRRTLAVETDITDPSACERLAAAAVDGFGRVDAVVNVAAIDRPFGGLLDGDLQDISRITEVNLLGSLQLTRAAVPALIDSGSGAVVFIGSIVDNNYVEEYVQLAYAASKAALRNAAFYLSRELGPRGVRVNYLAPGWMWGPTLQEGLSGWAAAADVPEEQIAAPILNKIALGRFATVDDVAEAVSFFCSDRSRAVTGQSIYIDGGIGH